MNAFLRRVMELRNAEQMASVGRTPLPKCPQCGRKLKPRAGRTDARCYACRHNDDMNARYREKSRLKLAPHP